MKLDGSTIVVTGGAGFLGRPVVARLEADGAHCIVPRSAEYDLTTEAAVTRLFADVDADAVVHLAARVGGIGANRDNPGYFMYSNMVMGAMMMEHARRAGVDKYLQVGTVCSYPKHTPVPFHETSLWDGYPEETNAPYGIAKRALLVQAQAYRRQYGLNAVTLLPVNLYGPHDNFDLESSHVIPALIRKMVDAGTDTDALIELWGDGSPSREFLYVDDCARAIVLALERYDAPDPVNLGTGSEITIRALAGLISQATGFGGDIAWDTSKPNGQPRRCLDTSRARDEFGFVSEVSFEDGLRETVAWYRNSLQAAA